MLRTTGATGSLLIEALISLLLVVVVTSAIASAISRISRSGYKMQNHLRPTCGSLTCEDNDTSVSCSCGSHRWSVVR